MFASSPSLPERSGSSPPPPPAPAAAAAASFLHDTAEPQLPQQVPTIRPGSAATGTREGRRGNQAGATAEGDACPALHHTLFSQPRGMGTKSGSSRPGQAREESWGFGVRRDGTKEKGVKETPIEAGHCRGRRGRRGREVEGQTVKENKGGQRKVRR